MRLLPAFCDMAMGCVEYYGKWYEAVLNKYQKNVPHCLLILSVAVVACNI